MNPLREVVADALPEYSQGICGDGAAILKDGVMLTIDEIVAMLNAYAAIAATQPGASAGGEERALLECIDLYWDLAYAEGKEGREHDTEAGDAQACRHEIERRIAALRTPAASVGDVGRVVEEALEHWEARAKTCDDEAERFKTTEPRLSRELSRDAGQYRSCIGGLRAALASIPPTQQEARAVDDTAAAATLRDVRDALGLVPGENVVHFARLAADAQYELARTQNWLYDIHRDMPSFPVTAETAEAATDSLMSVCYLLGCLDIPDAALTESTP